MTGLMKVLVVGLHHDLQRIHSTSDLESGRRAHTVQSPLFRQWLESKTTEVGARFIAEEIDEGAKTVAQEVAQRRGIDRANIDMFKPERERRGIIDNYWTLHKLGQFPARKPGRGTGSVKSSCFLCSGKDRKVPSPPFCFADVSTCVASPMVFVVRPQS